MADDGIIRNLFTATRTILTLAWCGIVCGFIALPAAAQDIVPSTTTTSPAQRASKNQVKITGDRLSGIVLPVEPVAGVIELSALRAWSWTVDDTQRLVLEGDVAIHLGGYRFSAPSAVVWLNRLPSAQGLINQVAVYFERVSDPTKQAGLGVGGQDLLVTGSTRGDVTLNATALISRAAPQSSLLKSAEIRLADHVRKLVAAPPPLQNRPQVDAPVHPDLSFTPVPGGRVSDADIRGPTTMPAPPRQDSLPWLIRPEGIIRFAAARTEIRGGEDETQIIITGPLSVDMQTGAADGDITQLTLTATRGVIFADPAGNEGLASGRLNADSIRGIYLEGHVAAVVNNGQYTVRAPQMYYDLKGDRAIMLDALLRTYPRDQQVPIYVRADEMRQLAANQWDVNKVNVSTSEFFTPHLSIGARQATVTQSPMPSNPRETETFITSRGNVMLVEGVPVVPFLDFSGRVQNPPLKSVEVGTRENDGLRILTTWDWFSLLGASRPEGVQADLHIDGFTERGVAVGSEFRYDVGDSHGKVDLYAVFDEGTDRTSSGRDVEPEKDFRGVALAEHTSHFGRDWTLQAQLAYISDRTFITAWRDEDFNERREYETSVYLKHQRENAALDFLAKYELNDFLSNSYLLASRQYTVDKAPELAYRRYGDSLLGDWITYSTENRATHMRLVFQDSTPREIGVPGSAFGIGDDDQIADALRAQGLTENWVNRFDSRHEVSLPLNVGAFKVTPFLVGRFTAYDDDFEDFSSDADSLRFFGAAGVRINTQLQRVYNGVENDLFDLHRLRHIIEPYVTLWHGYASVEQQDLPVYDTRVESLADGTAVQVGLRNTLQTQRGGPGRWRSVDFVTLDTSLVLTGDNDDPRDSPTPHFFDYRPEYSQLGDHIRSTAIWLLSDSFSIVGEQTYDLENHLFARSAVGMEMRHSPLLVTYIEYRYIDVDSNELLAIGWNYQLTPKYSVSLSPQWDFEADEFRSLSARITRTFPDFTFQLQVRYDQIRDDTAIGARLGIVEF